MQPIVDDAFKTGQADAVTAVIAAGGRAAEKGWVPATSGNFSVRIDAVTIAITRSGVDKGRLEASDVLIQPLDAPLLPGSSAEALLHIDHYRAHPATGAIFHTHSPHATVIGRAHLSAGTVWLSGWELQKALSGVRTHETAVEVPIFANDQDIARLSTRVSVRFAAILPAEREGLPAIRAPGYLLAGHGIYAFGATPFEAFRHLDAFEALFHQELLLRSTQS
jgi:methylthioribulose-1-phosphate dehydratase